MALDTIDYIGAVIETPWEEREDLRERRWWRIQRIERRERRKQAEATMKVIGNMSQDKISRCLEKLRLEEQAKCSAE